MENFSMPPADDEKDFPCPSGSPVTGSMTCKEEARPTKAPRRAAALRNSHI